MSWRHKLYPNYKKKKRRVHPDDVAPEVGHQQEVDKQQAIQDEDMEKGEYTQDPEQEDLSQQVNYSEEIDVESLTNLQKQRQDAKDNEEFDKTVSGGTLEDLRKGVDIKKKLGVVFSHLEKPRQVLTSLVIPDPTDFNEMSELFIDFKTAATYANKGRMIHPLAGVGAGILGFNQRRILERLATNIEFLGDGTLAKKLVDPSIDVPTYFAARRTNPENLGRRQTRAKTGKWLNTPDRTRKKILEDKITPTLEELDQAVVRGGNEVQGWRYDRSSVEGFSDDLAKQLQKEFGGTDAQRDAFQTLQKKAKSDLNKDIKALNKRMQFDYLEFANTAVQEGEKLGRKLTDEDIYEIFQAMAAKPKNADMFELGHNISAKNVARQKRKGKLTTADYKSNMDIEIKKSIKDLIFRENKSGEIIPASRQPMETSTKAKDSNVLRNVEKGNIARGSRTDPPKVIQLLKGVSPNVETEYVRFLDPQFDKILTDIIPQENHAEFMQFLRDGIKKWQGRGKDKLLGKQQLDQFPEKIRELADDYLELQEAKPYQVLKEDIDVMKKLNE